MSSKNMETIRAMHESLNRGDSNAALANVADNCTYVQHITGPGPETARTFHGKQEYKQLLQRRKQFSSDAKVKNARYMEAGDSVVTEFTIEGTNDGSTGDSPATHRHVNFDVCEIWQFDKSGRMAQGSCYFDVYTIMTQLGQVQATSRAA